ncbi:response regulator transcription factor [Nonomuraea zeae]|uniref:Response regulator transcription factor n=1 Tax=Nonomuraea zeae TaxID=1642303 RepID=A0A5S4GNT0_9ACTN|nr:LuxR C-terminal-related transcriptional regulator [Nonomuraea zeae]TMR34211.1 response regulator transcription factor [Nonomuraea zeae]
MSRSLKTSPMELSYQLGGLPDRAAYLSAAAECLLSALDGDVAGWNNLDLAARSVELWFDPPDAEIPVDLLAAVIDVHPLVRRYMDNPGDLAPQRISDCLPERVWRSHRVYSELFVPMQARHQLAIVVGAWLPWGGRGWAVNRSGRDFGQAQVEVAHALQPVLTLLDQIYGPGRSPSEGQSERRDEARVRAGLTSRELDVITLVANELSAKQIACLRRISVRTVRKHLENAYRKLGCHNQLSAVNRVRHLGLL